MRIPIDFVFVDGLRFTKKRERPLSHYETRDRHIVLNGHWGIPEIQKLQDHRTPT